MKRNPKLATVSSECVACGCCEKACPKKAIAVNHGIIARVDETACIGCGLCVKTCPAGVIEILERGIGK